MGAIIEEAFMTSRRVRWIAAALLLSGAAGSAAAQTPGGAWTDRASFEYTGVPPVRTIHGDQDPWVPYSDGERLHEALQKAGISNRLFTIPGGKHGEFSSGQLERIWATAREFLRQHDLPVAP
jgi:acetyl esterase/lipase